MHRPVWKTKMLVIVKDKQIGEEEELKATIVLANKEM